MASRSSRTVPRPSADCPQWTDSWSPSAPEELRETVEAADEAGIDELWLWEDCFLEGGLTTSAAALAWSERLTVGIGLLPVPLRNPAVTAMEIATLVRLFPGRFVPALGHGCSTGWRRPAPGPRRP
jgi:alkanesulfonate monooxygenase SsuD/methylene tetrahydromethanopterin reductase-like flavin-dependent oxidoreductase (luciferase family)